MSLRPRGGPRDGALAIQVLLFLLMSIVEHTSSDLYLSPSTVSGLLVTPDISYSDFSTAAVPARRMLLETNSETLGPLPSVETRSSPILTSQYSRSDLCTSWDFNWKACGTIRPIMCSMTQGYLLLFFLLKDLAREVHLPPTRRWNVPRTVYLED